MSEQVLNDIAALQELTHWSRNKMGEILQKIKFGIFT